MDTLMVWLTYCHCLLIQTTTVPNSVTPKAHIHVIRYSNLDPQQ
jgi:hypothetical protein